MKSVEFKVYFQTGYFSELYPMFNPSEFLAVNNKKKTLWTWGHFNEYRDS